MASAQAERVSGRRNRLAIITTSCEHGLVPCRGQFGLKAFVLVYGGPLNSLSSRLVRGNLQHHGISIILGGEAAENHDVDILDVSGSLHSLQLFYHLVYERQKRSRVLAMFYIMVLLSTIRWRCFFRLFAR